AIGSEAPQRLLASAGDRLRGEPAPGRRHAHLRRDHQLVAVAPRGHPAPDQLLGGTRARAAAPVAVGRVDEVATGRAVSVEHREGLLLVERPAEHVTAEAQREDIELGVAETRDAVRLSTLVLVSR